MKLKENSQGSEMLTHNQAAMLAKLTTELHVMNRHRFIRMHNSLWRLLTFNFMRGLAFGLGSVMGATVLLSILGYWLAQFEWLPLVGDWLGELRREIDPSRPDE
ncbi:DUF5665 domain-containing protein [Roseovarius aestuarii]|uniref:Uncharacterized protein n=1 Tax=Roseovarius aestuarii TaxID=475083 RepID=A0A1X7BP61_9RHOB|nr:DUF5665 domain-containing protein [Roseovarius aestuarii]SMC11403.1 hypothetical protein ROA7745_01216 [Roseovarius aestuarii]